MHFPWFRNILCWRTRIFHLREHCNNSTFPSPLVNVVLCIAEFQHERIKDKAVLCEIRESIWAMQGIGEFFCSRSDSYWCSPYCFCWRPSSCRGVLQLMAGEKNSRALENSVCSVLLFSSNEKELLWVIEAIIQMLCSQMSFKYVSTDTSATHL